MNISLFQRFFIIYIECGLYKKIGNRKEIIKMIKKDMEKVEKKNITFENLVKSRKEVILPQTPKKMPCGAFETDENHYPVLLCEYCDHKFTEASVPGFC